MEWLLLDQRLKKLLVRIYRSWKRSTLWNASRTSFSCTDCQYLSNLNSLWDSRISLPPNPEDLEINFFLNKSKLATELTTVDKYDRFWGLFSYIILVGARPWRYVFAVVSLPLALSSIVYFINHRFRVIAIIFDVYLLLFLFRLQHFVISLFLNFPCKHFRYDGIQLWDLRLEPGMHDFVWWSSLVSFLFLYPSTFNLLEVRKLSIAFFIAVKYWRLKLSSLM